jgi:polysaccharide chain length determinant protein (PEP-CTERM system associated)
MTPAADPRRDRRRGVEHPFGLRDPHEYLEVPLRWPLFVVAPAVLVLVAAVAASFVLPKRYRSSTLILVESEKVPETFVPKIATETMTRRMQTIRQEVLSRTRLERVIQDMSPYPPRRDGSPQPLSVQVERMRDSATLQVKGTDAFVIEYEHRDPEKAAAVANRLATLFIEQTEGERARQASEGFQFIDSQLVLLRQELDAKEQAVREFKERNIGALPEQMNSNLATLQRLQLEQQTVAESLSAARTRIAMLRQALQQEQRAAPSASREAPSESTQLRAQLAALRMRYTDQHPDVQAVAQRLRELEAGEVGPPPVNLEESSLPTQLKGAELEVESLEARQSRLDQEMGRLQRRVDLAPRTEQDLVALTRDLNQMRESYLALLKKRTDAQMAEQMERRWQGERFKILDPAIVPEEPVFPNRLLFAVGGLLGGLGLGLAAAFGREFLDHSVKSPDDLQELLAVPLLATIPVIGPRGSVGKAR